MSNNNDHPEGMRIDRNENSGFSRGAFYRVMCHYPWPFLILIPFTLIALAGAGWSKDNIIEENISDIWSPQSGDYFENKKYTNTLEDNPKYSGRTGATTFLGIAKSRDGGNLFTESRLSEIVDRMTLLEETAIDYKGNTYTWQDMCARNSAVLNTTYEWPCVRLSPMDLFQESRWSFDKGPGRITWYKDVIQDTVVTPRIVRFGAMQTSCASTADISNIGPCAYYMALRTDPSFASSMGKDPSYANPLLLFSDIGDWEESHPCKLCIESALENTMSLLTSKYIALFAMVEKILSSLGDQNASLLVKQASTTISRASIQEFYSYYVTRGLYAQLGASGYASKYKEFCSLCPLFGLPAEITQERAQMDLLNHADNTFSSNNIAGAPFPFWNESTGDMFGGTISQLKPTGGSGIDMSGDLLYVLDGTDQENFLKIMRDPGYIWFMAGVTPMTSHCGNEALQGTNITGNPNGINDVTRAIWQSMSPKWCTEYNQPFEIDEERTKLHFAKMWYDLVVDSEMFLKITQGVSDPYTWTAGEGCGYSLAGQRYSFTEEAESDILSNSSGIIYGVDEGASIGPLNRELLMGNTEPPVGIYNESKPLTYVGSIQNIYPGLQPSDLIERVKNCNRPGGTIDDLTEEDAKEILYQYKIKFEEVWSRGWDDDTSGEVQFVGFFDGAGAIGTTGRMLKEVTLSGGTLMAISFVIILVFSVSFLASWDIIQSRVFVTFVGVVLVILAFFGSLGLCILAGIKLNITIGWTLPFVIVGLGVDDMYIVSLALKKNGGYSASGFIETMKEVFIPVTMTSLVNFFMFAIMNVSDIPAVYKTAQAAMVCVAFLWLSILFCFPACCYLDMKRQRAGRSDVLCCIRKGEEWDESKNETNNNYLYEKIYKPFFIKVGHLKSISQALVWTATFALLGLGIWGATSTEIGLGLEDFFKEGSQALEWAKLRTTDLASWPISINWGEIDYKHPDVQMKMISQFEKVVTTPHVTDIDTKFLWIADLALWTTRHCDSNFHREDPSQPECGHDFNFINSNKVDEGDCSGTWVKNIYGLRQKISDEGETCNPYEGGVCIPFKDIHPLDAQEMLDRAQNKEETLDESAIFCPVFVGWSEEKLKFCVEKWRRYNGGGGGLLVEVDTATAIAGCESDHYKDDSIVSPIPISSGPATISAINLFSHDDNLDLLEETRAHCDNDKETHCWLSGIPFDFWEQYLNVEAVLFELLALSIAVGFAVSSIFLFGNIAVEKEHGISKVLIGSVSGGLFIAITCMISSIIVVGLSSLASVPLTALSVMSFVLSVGFVVEYSVHITHRFITAPMELETSQERVEHAMSFLFLPTFMSFVSSTVGVICLAFTEFHFNTLFFFRPLIIVMLVTYFCGCYFLPALLSLLNFEFLRLGHYAVSEGAPAKKNSDIKDSEEGT